MHGPYIFEARQNVRDLFNTVRVRAENKNLTRVDSQRCKLVHELIRIRNTTVDEDEFQRLLLGLKRRFPRLYWIYFRGIRDCRCGRRLLRHSHVKFHVDRVGRGKQFANQRNRAKADPTFELFQLKVRLLFAFHTGQRSNTTGYSVKN